MTITYVGIAAAVLTTASNLPQAWKTIKTQDTKSLSFGTFSMLFAGTVLWSIYGWLIKDYPILVANGISTILSGIIFYLKLRSII